MEDKMKVGLIGSVIVWVAIAWVVSGCSSQTGWSFGIGVYPVTGVDHQQTLKQESVTDSQTTNRGR